MTNKMTKALAVMVAFGAISTSAFANSNAVGGGWEEGKGYFYNGTQNPSPFISTYEVKEYPNSHEGKVVNNPNNFREAKAVGHTKWKGKWHYTRAQMTWLGMVRLDSKRQWDYDETHAETDWGPTEYSGKTFWGNEE
ncbi:hypothetical protein NLX71_15810 [Paenibacillus sp. MZ04-78.2]|uniref:hypothetical protein n=1 Tax=Paenibacillus sp. MZ04-78.2 TaxID=2962034 RepID=UPI0020B8717E|nr:hypothetical protein [Paenibacillus sp. MZ04-78.2]MCP3774758.1 hypothetical protein [Paenibacillus sp. MZ04-78.2]